MPWKIKNIPRITSTKIYDSISKSIKCTTTTENGKSFKSVMNYKENKGIIGKISLYYKILAEKDSLYLFNRKCLNYKYFSNKDLEKLYDKMVEIESKKYHEYILSKVGLGKCFYCAVSPSQNIDHYLPKDQFPELSIEIYNLVPSCSKCNSTKSTYFSLDKDKQLIHPYFNMEYYTSKWMYAYINKDYVDHLCRPPITFIAKPDNMNNQNKERLKNHFKVLRLNDIYVHESLSYLLFLARRLDGLQNSQLRQEFLREESKKEYPEDISFEMMGPNWWKSVLCECLAEDQWYCEQGYKDIRDSLYP